MKTEAGQTFPDKPTVSDTYYAKTRYFVNRELSGKTFKYNSTKRQWISTDGAKAFDAIDYSEDGGVSTLFYNGAFTNFESSEYNNYSITFSKATIVVGGK